MGYATTEEKWWRKEFLKIQLGDHRLNARLVAVAHRLAAQPNASINQACGTWSETKAAYRLFGSEKLESEKITAAHASSSKSRMKNGSTILIIQDTSFLNYTEHFKTKGLGPIEYNTNPNVTKTDAKGLIVHTALAINTNGTPVGILDQNIWARSSSASRSKHLKNRKRIPVENKESNKWLRALERSMKWIPEGVEAVTVCDRESDLYEFIGKAETLRAKYLIRSSWNRFIKDDKGQECYLRDYMKKVQVSGTFEVEVEGKRLNKQKVGSDRIAKMELRFSSVLLRRPPKKKVNREECKPYFKAFVIWVNELRPPKGEVPLNWMLLTNVEVRTFDEALEKVDWYKSRWHIENFHKTLKSGCNVELCRLGRIDRLERFIALSSIIAWRLYWLTHLHRSHPQENCTVVLQDHEWKALYTVTKKTPKLPKTPPTAREATRWIAQLGGFLARKGDGEPGIISIWRGWQRLTTLAEQWLILHPP